MWYIVDTQFKLNSQIQIKSFEEAALKMGSYEG